MRIQCISRRASTCSLPTTGMLFSAWQATTQALQPMQVLRLIAMPQALPVASSWRSWGGRVVDQAQARVTALVLGSWAKSGCSRNSSSVADPDRGRGPPC